MKTSASSTPQADLENADVSRRRNHCRTVSFLKRGSGADALAGVAIGAGGQVLKDVGRLARQEIETMVGNRVYLELWVKVRKDWRNKSGSLRSFGYGNEKE